MKAKLIALAPQSFGYLLCNSIRAFGALSGFLVAFASIKYGDAAQYGLFLFAVSILSFVPDYFSHSAANEYLNRYSYGLARNDDSQYDSASKYRRFTAIFNLFLFSCVVSFVAVLVLPLPSNVDIGFLLALFATLYVYLRQHLHVFSQKARLHLTPVFADFTQYVIPQVLWFSLLFAFHFLNPVVRINALHIATFAALSYLLAFLCVAFSASAKTYLTEPLYPLRLLVKSNQELLFSKSGKSIFADDLALGGFFAHIVSRIPSIFIGYTMPAIGSVAVYGILQRIQYLILIPAYSYISFNMKSLSDSFAKQDRKKFWRLTAGLLLISTLACILFLVGYFFFNDHLNWLFTQDGVGLQIDNSLIILAISVIIVIALESYSDNVMIVYGLLRTFKQSQLARLAIILLGFSALALYRVQSLSMIYLVEAASLISVISILALRLPASINKPILAQGSHVRSEID